MKRILFILSFIILIISCKKSNKIGSLKDNNFSNKSKLKIFFYDTVFQFKKTQGKVIYNMDLDSLNLSMIRKRYVFFVASVDDKKLETFDEIGRNADYMAIDSVENGVFPFYIEFPELGKSVLNIAFEESILLKEGDKAIRLNVVESKPVFVLDSSLIVGNLGDTIYFEQEREVRMKRKDSAKFVNESRRKADSLRKVLQKQ